jgi:transcription antitermination factor NusB
MRQVRAAADQRDKAPRRGRALAAPIGEVERRNQAVDPVERAVLLIALYELTARPDVPYRVAINEAVALAKRFGATDGFKFVNAVLDRAARALPGRSPP